MRRYVQAIAVTAMVTALIGGCSEATAPVAESPPAFAFEVTAAGARTASFTGHTQVTTVRNGHSEPGPGPGSALVSQDYTPLLLAQPELDFAEPNAYLALGLVGPFDVGTFTLKSPGSDLNAPRFFGTYSVRVNPDAWEHYEITGGSITFVMKGNRLSGTLDLQSTRVQRVNLGFSTAPDTTTLTLTGRIAAVR